jgi:hypothetical protein
MAVVAATYSDAWDYLNVGGMPETVWKVVTRPEEVAELPPALDAVVYLGGELALLESVENVLAASNLRLPR